MSLNAFTRFAYRGFLSYYREKEPETRYFTISTKEFSLKRPFNSLPFG